MRLMRAVLGLLALSVLVAGLAVACGGDGESEKPAAVTSPEGVVREFTSGSAKATVKVVPLVPAAGRTEGQTLTFEGGDCSIGGDDEWLEVIIGGVSSGTYFGLIAGRAPASQESTRLAKGGGEFKEGEFNVTWTGGGSGSLLIPQQSRLTIASDLKSGEFEGTDSKRNSVSGSFTCA
jgi:hypothetical protein